MSNRWHQLNTNEHGAFNGCITRGVPRSLWRKRVTNIPEWTLHDDQVKEFLLRVFPRMLSNQVQWKRAMRWMGVIQVYYRAARPASEVADTLNISEKVARDTIRRIQRAARGLRTTGRTRTTGKPGRPRKINDSLTF